MAQLSTLDHKSYQACFVIERFEQFEFAMSESRKERTGFARAGWMRRAGAEPSVVRASGFASYY